MRVARVVEETADASSIVFDADPRQVLYRPGQFLTVRLPGDAARSYSLSSSPDTDAALSVTIKRVPDGFGSNHLLDSLRPGSKVDVLPPAGVFTPRSFDADLALLAAGSGITPVLSIVKSVLAAGRGRIHLVYANRDSASVIFARQLRAQAERYPDRFTVVHWLEELQGLPDPRRLASLLVGWGHAHAFMCGPTGFMNAGAEALELSGLPRERHHREVFVSHGTSPFLDQSVPESHDVPVGRVRVELDGEISEHPWPEDRGLLDTLLAEGLDAPYSCREGHCGACACRVVQGRVKQAANDVLPPDDVAQGWVLACQSHPLSGDVHVTFDEE